MNIRGAFFLPLLSGTNYATKAPMNREEMLEKALAESKSKQKLLEQQLEDLTDFVENGSLPMHWVNGSGIIIWANQAELDMLGYTKAEFVGQHIAHFHADKNVIEDILARLIAKETIRNYQARLVCKNGEMKNVLINSNVYWKDGAFLHTRCFTRDISELKKAELQKTDLINDMQQEILKLKAENALLKKKGAGIAR
jgi:two-component system sensor histidine kinase VicK